MEHLYFLYMFSGSAKLISCLTIAFLALAALFTYLSRISKNNLSHRESLETNLSNPTLSNTNRGKSTIPHSSQPIKQPEFKGNQESPPPPPAPANSEQIAHLEQEKAQLEEALSAQKMKYEALFEEQSTIQTETEAAQNQIVSLQKTIKSLYTTYQNLLNKYEEAQRAHLFELKTLFKKTSGTISGTTTNTIPGVTSGPSPEISSLFTFHRQLRSPEEQLYFLASLMDKDAVKEGSSIVSTLQALDVRRRLKVLDMYHEIPWILFNPKTSEIDGSSKSCPKLTQNQFHLIEHPLKTVEYELFQVEIGNIPCIGIMLDQSQTHALLVAVKSSL